MRFLCLHGIGTSTAILETQIAALRFRLGNEHEYEFVEGPFEWPPANGIEAAFGKQEATYSYFEANVASIKKAVDDLAEFIDNDGPFDGVIGFSQGGALATTLIVAEERGLIPRLDGTKGIPRFRFAIVLSCGLPWDYAKLETGEDRRLDPQEYGECIHIPTAHFWGENDMEGFVGNHEVTLLCQESSRVEVSHTAGHGIPSGSRPQELEAMVSAIELTIQRAVFEGQ